MGQHLKAESTSRVAASVPMGASMTIFRTSLKVPQSHLNFSISISQLTEEREGSFRGNDRSWTIRRSTESTVLGTVPNGDVRNGPIRDSSLEREKGPVYRCNDNSLWIWDNT
jgi:hypothetical protein